MYLPSYRRGMPTETVAQRQAALRGFVYSPIRMHDFVRAALVNMPAEVDFDLYSGQSAQPERLLFSSRQTRERMTPADYAPRFSVARTIEAYGASWHFLFTSRPSFDAEFSHEKSLFMLFGGVLLSCLLSTLVFMQGRARRQAQVIAEQMARRVAAQQKLALHVQQTPLAVIEWDESFRVTAWNHSAEEIFGYTAEEAFGRDASFIIPDSAPGAGKNRVPKSTVRERRSTEHQPKPHQGWQDHRVRVEQHAAGGRSGQFHRRGLACPGYHGTAACRGGAASGTQPVAVGHGTGQGIRTWRISIAISSLSASTWRLPRPADILRKK
jgi:PAS domain S-box